MSGRDDYGFILSLPGFDAETATPEQCAVHSAYPNPLVKMGADPAHFGKVDVFFTSNVPVSSAEDPFVIFKMEHGYNYVPASLTLWLYTPPGEAIQRSGTGNFTLNYPNDFVYFATDEKYYFVKLTKTDLPATDTSGLSFSFRYYIFAQPATP